MGPVSDAAVIQGRLNGLNLPPRSPPAAAGFFLCSSGCPVGRQLVCMPSFSVWCISSKREAGLVTQTSSKQQRAAAIRAASNKSDQTRQGQTSHQPPPAYWATPQDVPVEAKLVHGKRRHDGHTPQLQLGTTRV